MSKFEQVLDGWAEAQAAIEIAESALIGHLDFEPTDACEHPDKDGNPAAWVCRYRCCGKSVLICDKHHRNWERKVAIGWGTGVFHFVCEYCGDSKKNLAEVFDWFPIGGAS